MRERGCKREINRRNMMPRLSAIAGKQDSKNPKLYFYILGGVKIGDGVTSKLVPCIAGFWWFMVHVCRLCICAWVILCSSVCVSTVMGSVN